MDMPESRKVWTYDDLKKAPYEVLIRVLAQLDPVSLVNFCSASKDARIACKPAWKDIFQRDFTSQRICQRTDWEKLYRLAATGYFSVYEIKITDADPAYAIEQVNVPAVVREGLRVYDIEESKIDQVLRDLPEIEDPEVEYGLDVDDINVYISYSGTIPIGDVLRHLKDRKQYISGYKVQLTTDDGVILDADYTLDDDKLLDIARRLLLSYGAPERDIDEFEEESEGEEGYYTLPESDIEIELREVTIRTADFRQVLPLLCKM